MAYDGQARIDQINAAFPGAYKPTTNTAAEVTATAAAAALKTDSQIGDDATASNAAKTTTAFGKSTVPTSITTTSPTVTESSSKTQNMDRRARIRPKPGAETYVYGDAGGRGLLSVLRVTNGMVFPTTPTIAESHQVSYSSYSPTHSIAKFNSYERTENVNIQISGDFFVTNASEARYLLACIHFLRSVTKMDFGANSNTRGTPPPVLIFSAYGNFMYNDVPVIIKGAAFTLQPDIDYIQVPLSGIDDTMGGDNLKSASDFYRVDLSKPDRVWVPSKLSIALTLEQQTTGEWLTNHFDLNSFKRGGLLTKGGMI